VQWCSFSQCKIRISLVLNNAEAIWHYGRKQWSQPFLRISSAIMDPHTTHKTCSKIDIAVCRYSILAVDCNGYKVKQTN
jgi:hypothetical protein